MVYYMTILDPKMKYYKYVTFDVLSKILENKCIKVTYPAEFNDPFDCDLARVDLEASEIHNIAMKQALGDINDKPEMKQLIEGIAPELLKILNDVFVELLDSWNEDVEKFRVLSLTESPDNILMWSHYADNHRGAVIELEFPGEQRQLISQVKYGKPSNFASTIYKEIRSFGEYMFNGKFGEKLKNFSEKNELGKLTINDFDKFASLIDEALPSFTTDDIISAGRKELNSRAFKIYSIATEHLLTKLSIWNYEKEHRMILYNDRNDLKEINGLTLLPLGENAIKKVIFGVNANDEDREAISKLLREKYSNVEISKAVKSNWAIEFESCG